MAPPSRDAARDIPDLVTYRSLQISIDRKAGSPLPNVARVRPRALPHRPPTRSPRRPLHSPRRLCASARGPTALNRQSRRERLRKNAAIRGLSGQPSEPSEMRLSHSSRATPILRSWPKIPSPPTQPFIGVVQHVVRGDLREDHHIRLERHREVRLVCNWRPAAGLDRTS